jgi:hypothetical protein
MSRRARGRPAQPDKPGEISHPGCKQDRSTRRPLALLQMREHIESFQSEDIHIYFTPRPVDAFAIRWPGRDSGEIHTAPIRSALSYATALHELGHILGRFQHSRRQKIREHWAWEWARKNALLWTPAMERHANDALTHLRPAREGDQ